MSLIDSASLIVTPNGYKEGKLYSVIPSDGSGDLSVTRATTATRVNSQGLVELVPYNYKVQSENLTLGVGLDDTNITTITANTTETLDPFGGNNAEKYNGSTGQYADSYNFIPQNSVVTSSLYVKAGTATSFTLRLNASFGTYAFATFNLTNGTVTTTGTDGFAYISSAINSVGNGWYRCSLTYNFISFPTNRILLAQNGSIYVFGWQLVEGSVAKDYQKTETRLNIPRLDYSNGTCPSILVEPQRTNIATYSEAFNLTGFSIDTSISANTTTSPSGIQNADSLIENTANGNHLYYIDYSVTNGTTYTYSVFCKSIGGRNVEVRSTNAFAEERAIINLSDGSIFSESTSQIAVADFGNGWYRISITKQATTSVGRIIIFALDGISLSYQGNGTSGLYLFGAQLEAGSYATSYIPTTSASVTRNADVISKTGISSLIGQTEGTLFLDVYRESVSSQICVFLSNSTGANAYMNSIYIFQIPNNYLTIDCFVSNVGQFSIQTGAELSVGRHKIAVAYKQNDAVVYIDGVLFGSDNSCNIPPMSVLDLNPFDTGFGNNAEINATAIWKTRLTNAQLATLTTI